MSEALFTAQDFRRRALEQVAPLDQAWREHGDHVLNRDSILEIEQLNLRDAAVLVAVIDDPDEARVILTKRTDKLRKHAGQIAFPGGGIDEADLSPEEAALREAEEEIGLDRRFVETVGRLPQYLAGTGFRIQPVLAVVQPGFVITPNPDEVESVFEVPLSFLMNPDNHRQDSRVWQGAVRHFYVMPYRDRHIWGITAGIIRTLYERLYA
ncbi:DNA mismatch repair protein MutT [Rhizobium sp. Root274]|uniref:CoA pyrophosphatase n=1 Tax=unclassified Rhizobium TaxID=2613769 RepID=UPI00071582E5|nr:MULTISPECIES: CoA pyrophosphatase [unclassified Rhizobium]KQW29003.1 DNA mismatch repair protein MutT [Rhizobium sp. Root1240]KRD29199.1 DNA mismatch repair protein MutT [Rhizobium sp. Root274]